MPGRSDPELEAARAAARRRFAHLAELGAEMNVEQDVETSVDGDDSILSDAQLEALRPSSDVHPRLVAASLARRAARPERTAGKGAVSMRLDADVADALKAQGTEWQARANALLRAALNLEG